MGWTIKTIIIKNLSRGMLKQVTGRFGPESSRPGSFWPGSIRSWVISAQFGGSSRSIFSRSHICELIVYGGICRPSLRRPSVCQHFQTTSPLKP